MNKSGFSLSFVVQVDDYEPVKLYAYEECEYDGERPTKLDLDLATKVMKRLEDLSLECVKKVKTIKSNMMDELDD